MMTCSLLKVRAKLFELLTHCIPPEVIIKVLTRKYAVIDVADAQCRIIEKVGRRA